MLSNEEIRLQLKDTRDIVRRRTAGVVHKMASAADDDVPYGADDNFDEDGGYNIGYYRDGYSHVPPPANAAESFSLLRGTIGGRDPLMGHQLTAEMAAIREKCMQTLWQRAGVHWGAGYTGAPQWDGAEAGPGPGSTRRGARSSQRAARSARSAYDDDEDDNGGGMGGRDDDDGLGGQVVDNRLNAVARPQYHQSVCS